MKEKYLRYAQESRSKAENLKNFAGEQKESVSRQLWLDKAAWFLDHATQWEAKAAKC